MAWAIRRAAEFFSRDALRAVLCLYLGRHDPVRRFHAQRFGTARMNRRRRLKELPLRLCTDRRDSSKLTSERVGGKLRVQHHRDLV